MLLEAGKKIHALVCPLNWGLGHATRCIPIVNSLLSKGAIVTLAASGRSKVLLEEEFPQLEVIEFKGFSPLYPSNGSMLFRMFTLIPSFLFHVFSEHIKLSQLIRTRQIDTVISDNRYGLWNTKVKSILITHQVFIRAPKGWKWLNRIVFLVNRFLISRFDECWVPDFPGEENLSGELSHQKPAPKNCFFIGPLSRLQKLKADNIPQKGILVVLSGPEPQREILERILTRQLENMDIEALIIQGIAEMKQEITCKGKITILNFANSSQLNEYLCTYPIVICRPGYTTIMDLAIIGGKALFMSRNIALNVSQNEINLNENIPLAYSYQGFTPLNPDPLFEHRIELLTKR
jgi:uncharacterized protein (TIGR00661 family)